MRPGVKKYMVARDEASRRSGEWCMMSHQRSYERILELGQEARCVIVTPKGVLPLALCHASATLECA